MFLEDPIIRKSREKIRAAINNKFQDEGSRIYFNDHLYEILETICEYFNNNSLKIFELSKEYKEDILEILNKKGIHIHTREYHSLRGVIDTILKERYRSHLPFDTNKNLPKSITATDIYGEYIFDDLLCLNDTDYRNLRFELRKFLPQNSPTLSEMVEEASPRIGKRFPRYLSYDYLPYSKSLRRYQRLRMLDAIMAEASDPISIDEIDRRIYILAKENNIDPNSLWKINSYISHDSTSYERNPESIYKQDFLTLAELIAPSEHQYKRRKDVYRFDSYGRRCYSHCDMSAFKLVIPASKAISIYQELKDTNVQLDDFKYWHFPLIYAIASYGKYQETNQQSGFAYDPDKIQNMKYYKTGSILNYNDDFADNNNILFE